MKELEDYAERGFVFHSPGVVLGECLYVLCKKQIDGNLSAQEHSSAIEKLSELLQMIEPPPGGDRTLVRSAERIRQGLGCSRSADGIFLALAEELAVGRQSILLTFDQGIEKQAGRSNSSVLVHLLK